MGHYFRLYPEVTLNLFDALVKPILLYASDFWGCLKMPTNNPIENIHTRFCKDILGVQRQTTNVGVLLDLGRVPIMLFAKKNCIKNWGRIHIIGKANEIVMSTHHIAIRYRLKWAQAVTDCLNNIGIGGLSKNEYVHNTAIKRMTDIFHQEAFAEINRDESKLRTYAKIKTEIGIEKYLFCIPNVETRIAVSRIRLSNHDLMIEKGRHLNLEISRRNCPLCTGCFLEDEYHFLLWCKTFSPLRNELFLAAKTFFHRFEYYSREQQLKMLLSDEQIVNITGNFLRKALELRRFLIENHKNVI